MFLTFFTVFYVLFGTSCGFLSKEVCYGDSVEIRLFLSNFYGGSLYFYPRAGGPRTLLLENQEAKDPRLKVSTHSATLTQLTERDNGNFVTIGTDGHNSNLLSLTILDCSSNMSLFYGQQMMRIVPSNAELLEFTPFDRLDQPQLLWERATPYNNYGGRGKVRSGLLRISKVTQEDNGYYNFRQKDKSIALRLRLTVQEKTSNYDTEENTSIFLPFPQESGDWTVTFTPLHREEEIKIIEGGREAMNINPLYQKMTIETHGIDLCCLKYEDAGIFKFRDPGGNLALVTRLHITKSHHAITYAIVSVVAVGVLICCCCCCKKCCCKKEKPPSEDAPPAAEPKVYYHDLNKPAGSGFSAPPYSAAFPPPAVNAGIPHDAAAASSGPVVHQPTYTETNIFQPEITPRASEPSAPSSSFGYNPLSSESQPMFETHQPTYEIKKNSQSETVTGASEPSAPSSSFGYNALSSDYQPMFETHQPTYEIKKNSQSGVVPRASEPSAPSSSFGYNPLSSDYQPMFEVKGLSYNFDLPLNTETSSTDVYKSDKMNFL